MTISLLKDSLSENNPPQNLSIYLKALWYDAKGEWDKAHKLMADINDKNASWIHAYLHRKEGDISNADYWYSKAGKSRPTTSLNTEWEQIASTLLQNI